MWTMIQRKGECMSDSDNDAAMIKPNWHRAQHEARESIRQADAAVERAGQSACGYCHDPAVVAICMKCGHVPSRVIVGGPDVYLEPGKYLWINEHGATGIQNHSGRYRTVFSSLRFIRMEEVIALCFGR